MRDRARVGGQSNRGDDPLDRLESLGREGFGFLEDLGVWRP
jgi:hypothetical protein